MISVNALYAPPARHCDVNYKKKSVEFMATSDQFKKLQKTLIATGVVEFESEVHLSPSESDLQKGRLW